MLHENISLYDDELYAAFKIASLYLTVKVLIFYTMASSQSQSSEEIQTQLEPWW